MVQKNEKLGKSIKESQTSNEDSLNTLNETLRAEIDQMRKKISRELKTEIESKQYALSSDVSE